MNDRDIDRAAQMPPGSMLALTDDQIIKRVDLQRRLGVCSGTMRLWMKGGKLPPPDLNLTRQSVGWKVGTLRAAGINI